LHKLSFFIFAEVMKDGCTVHSLFELEKCASQLLHFSKERKVFAFFGVMGSGKTTFIKEICKQLNVTDSVSSPTFSLMNEYMVLNGKSVFHFDFYRIKNEKEAVDIGCEEYFYSGHYCFVEWSEKILNLLPNEIVRIAIEVPGIYDETRLITFQYD
jgi:tRNA threonylcarbamoyladenosine biosynthesis protein TsaE